MHVYLPVNSPRSLTASSSRSPRQIRRAPSGILFSAGRALRRAGAAVLLLACGAMTPGVAQAATYTVTSTDDSVPAAAGTLRWAIEQATSNPGPDTITFNISGSGVHTITLVSEFYIEDNGVTIDGTTQPGYAGTPLIEITGNGVVSRGLYFVEASDCLVRGLCINGITDHGLYFETCTRCTVQACYLGVDPTATTPVPIGFSGVAFVYGGEDNVIGGTGNGEGNLFGAIGIAVDIMSAARTRVQGNLFGTNPAGTASFSQSKGIRITSAVGPASDTLIGGTEAGAGNVITHASYGLEVNSMNTVIQGNRIGITSGGAPAGNGTGILTGDVTVIVGGTDAGAGNIIAHNSTGISLAATANARASRILGNRIFANSGMAIDVHGNGPTPNDNPDTNGITNYPVLGATDVVSLPGQVIIPTTLQALPSTSYIVEYFRHAPSNTDVEFLGRVTQTTNASGLASFDGVFPTFLPAPGWYVTATATPSAAGATGTSEFSSPVLLPVSVSRFEAE